MSKVITGLFMDSVKASDAIMRLEAHGVIHADISIVANDSYSKEDFAVSEGSKAAEGGAIGATATGILGAVVAGLTAVGAVATGGAGIIATGPLVAALAGGGAGAAVGGTIGGIIGSFIPEHELKYYEDAIEKGSVLVGVKYDNYDKDAVEKAFEDAGADKVSKA
ncbi:hypothetical protein [Alteromonas oceanisediminis]|uniref:hypothetical protein n=1 Tax=Alteromonas oceanisediminis TaxID=2836180 RepID=UPI001BDB0A44|nr:hypothetical protein [Alteromonas oceanisediminis]MBT0587568.1 hypothetical protein [Alteromonas oceanisediminis]